MANEFLEILPMMDVKTIPQIATHHHTAKAQVSYLADIVEADATKCIDMTVDESMPRGLFQLYFCKGLSVSRICMTVKERL